MYVDNIFFQKISMMFSAVFFSVVLGQVLGSKVGILHMHGIMESYKSHFGFKQFIERETGIPVRLINAYNCISSITPIKYQAEDILKDVKEIASQYDQIIAVGYSQGGIIWRTMIEMWEDHNVVLFISLASPQHGIYGTPPLLEMFLPFLDPFSRSKAVYKIGYSKFGQTLSFFNYYLDPTNYDIYLKGNKFFPELNNEAGTPAEKELRKKNFLKLSKFVLIGGPGENVIDPWQSTVFGYYTEDGFDKGMIPMEESRLFVEDLFGLRSLAERGDLVKCIYPGIGHLKFRDDPNMLRRCVLPALRPYNQV